jgi:hypothetical protein
MAVYSIRKAIKKIAEGGETRLKKDIFPHKDRTGGSLLEVVQALYATYIPWEVTFSDTEEMAVHAATLHSGARGQILYFGGAYHAHYSYIYDPKYDRIEQVEEDPNLVVTTDMFCSGHSLLHDGSLLVTGGQLPSPGGEEDEHQHGGMSGGGERHCYKYWMPFQRWVEVEPLNLDPHGKPESGGRWYPTLLTLADGLVLAVGGHPDVREVFPNEANQRHSNNVPERYDPSKNEWKLLEDGTTAENAVPAYDYQRTHLLPDGKVFFSSAVKGKNRVYNGANGTFDPNRVVDLPAEGIYRDATSMAVYTSVLLPLLHEENYVARVMLCGDRKAYLCDFGDSRGTVWRETGRRDWPREGNPPVRLFSIATLLPNGEIFISGGTQTGNGNPEASQEECVLEGEVFNPNFDLEAAGEGKPAFDPETAEWRTVQAGRVGRRYHSTALLLADGSVWTCGSNGTLDIEDAEEKKSERRIEVYRPAYLEAVDRPEIVSAPDAVRPADTLEVSYTSKYEIEQVVFLRTGSVTHGFNPDQRLITAAFERINDSRLRVSAPPNHEVAPPGYYMLWLLDDQCSPCREAHFIQIFALA